MIDAHSHVAISFTEKEQVSVIKNFIEHGGTKLIDVSTCAEDIPAIERFIAEFNCAYATVGVHPEISPDIDQEKEIDALKAVLNNKKVIGLGEVGLDFLAADKYNSLNFQIELFVRQIMIAKQSNLPLIIHARGRANDDSSAYIQILEILKQENFTGKVYFHSFGGDKKIAYQMIDNGYLLGINGIATYTGAKHLAEAVISVPLTSLLLETDTPYLTPSNMDRELLLDKKRNEPIAILFTAKRIAKLKNIPLEEVLEVTEKATLEFFDKML